MEWRWLAAPWQRWGTEAATRARLIRFRIYWCELYACARAQSERERARERWGPYRIQSKTQPSCEKSIDGGSNPAPGRQSPRPERTTGPAARSPARTAADAPRIGGSPEGPPSRCAVRRGERGWPRGAATRRVRRSGAWPAPAAPSIIAAVWGGARSSATACGTGAAAGFGEIWLERSRCMLRRRAQPCRRWPLAPDPGSGPAVDAVN
uniref:Uncharacterized protein n=1 Tax=Aegilops tauschii subsp. strangulata TaxID=200361 RepID=A0A453T575_AEGTS